VSVDTPEQLEGLKLVGRLVANTLAAMRAAVRPGITTGELDAIAGDYLKSRGARSGPIITYGYPGHTCISVNEEVVHAIPGARALHHGDIVTVDVAAELDGYHADAAITVPVGTASGKATRLMVATRAALAAGIRAAQPGATLRDVGAAIQRASHAAGFRVIPQLTGHGIGLAMHEPPTVFNWPAPFATQVLDPGLVLTIEPMLAAGRPGVVLGADGWTVRTADRSLSAHEEHTVMVAPGGPLILTA
jgi:methionyl aminopeptidase